jgi:acetate kinase
MVNVYKNNVQIFMIRLHVHLCKFASGMAKMDALIFKDVIN